MESLEVLGKLVGSAILAALIGWDREKRARSAGLRTHMLVAISATLFVALTESMVARLATTPNVTLDPSRVIEAIVAGVSFLGAGTIFVSRGKTRVFGLTTAAGLLATAAIGAAIGLESYLIAIGTAAIVLVVMRVILHFEGAWTTAASKPAVRPAEEVVAATRCSGFQGASCHDTPLHSTEAEQPWRLS